MTLPLARRFGIRLQFQQVGLEQNHFQQLVDALFGQRGNIDENRIATPFVRHEAFVLKLLADFERVGVRVIASC